MKLNTLLEVLTAAHLAHLVNAPVEFSARGGVMFIAPPGQFKTVITKTLKAWEPQALVLGDLTIRQLVEMRDEISSGKVRTLGFSEFPKLYGRNKDTASNLEGAIHQMVAEGFTLANWEDQRLIVRAAHALVVGAMPPDFYKKHFTDWTHSGFMRRFLWCHFQLVDSDVITRAIRLWEPVKFGGLLYTFPAANSIPFDVTQQETLFIEDMLRRSKSGCESVPYILLKKIACVLKWRHAEQGKKKAAQIAMTILGDFGPSLQKVVDLEIDEPQREVEHKPARSVQTA